MAAVPWERRKSRFEAVTPWERRKSRPANRMWERRKSRFTIGFMVFGLLFLQPAWPDEARYLRAEQVDLTRLLAPPPAPGSAEDRRDLEAVLAAQRARTPDSAKAAQADAEVSVFRFADVIGPAFTAERLPRTAALFRQASREASAVIQIAKRHWGRPRPFDVSDDVKPVAELARNGAYPSGHAAFGQLAAILLAEMVPEKRAELFARGRAYGENRVVAGLHYPTDVEAGRLAATAIAAALLRDAEFSRDFAASRAEVRAALGLD
jgi:acid phosphatase (class A)